MSEANARNVYIRTEPKGADSPYDIPVDATDKRYDSPAEIVTASQLSPKVAPLPEEAQADRLRAQMQRQAAADERAASDESGPADDEIGWMSQGAGRVKE